MGHRFNQFASGEMEIELSGENPPDIGALKEAAANTATQSYSVSGGAAMTMVIK